mmetsp:Transcript_43685/g.68403  ORF Transcript_43685/g.68403 Transcript_43685/m.68403 type:complete len:127 (-) Transcript_43685:2092-2472(-)
MGAWTRNGSTVLLLFLNLAVEIVDCLTAKPTKLSRVSVDVCPFSSVYVEMQHKIHKRINELEAENLMLNKQLEAESQQQRALIDKAISLASSSISDFESDDSWDKSEHSPLRLRGGTKDLGRRLSR